jgi:hypothetical protein
MISEEVGGGGKWKRGGMQPPPDARRCARPRQSAKRSTAPVVHRFFELMLSFLSRGSFQRPGLRVPFVTELMA